LLLNTRVGSSLLEEFAIYLNYVRKLGFEEAPDYDFMRDLFTKALEGTGEVEDGIYDWMLLNNGKGWQANSVSFTKTCPAVDFIPLHPLSVPAKSYTPLQTNPGSLHDLSHAN
jgi:hypothetical protein